MGELQNDFSWSKSRAETFEACPRQYFYSYYGAWGGWSERADPKTRTLYVLKKLQTRQQWMGATVHNCLRWVLTELREKGRAPSEDAALRALGRRLQKDFTDSGEGLYWEKPREACGLLEHEYDDLEVGDEVWAGLFEKALSAVSVFYRGEPAGVLQALAPDQWLDLERLASFDADGVKVWVQLDCAYRRDGILHIIDWKTGKADAESTRAQLALYAWYAHVAWAADPSAIEPSEYNLGGGEWIAHHFTAADFEPVRARIAAGAAAMRALLDDPAQNRAREDRFALTDGEKTCRKCPFRRVCPRWAGT